MRIAFFSMALLFAGIVLASAPDLSPRELHDLIESEHGPVIVDVRSAEEFSSGHVPGAINIPLDQVDQNLEFFRQHDDIVLYCRSGRRSGMAEEQLASQGISTRQMTGSFLAWQAAELPIESSEVEQNYE